MVQIASDSSQGFCDRDLNHILLDRLNPINISQYIGKDNIITEGENARNDEHWFRPHVECTDHFLIFLKYTIISLFQDDHAQHVAQSPGNQERPRGQPPA